MTGLKRPGQRVKRRILPKPARSCWELWESQTGPDVWAGMGFVAGRAVNQPHLRH